MSIKKIKINNYILSVIEKDRVNDNQAWGETDIEKLEVVIKKSLPPIHKKTTLIHELIHVMLYLSGIIEHDEHHIEAISIRFYEMIHDNPDLINYLENLE